VKDAKRSSEPQDRLTRIAGRLIERLSDDPELQGGDKVIVMLEDATSGGIAMAGYESDADAIAALFMYLKVVFEANGRTLTFVPIHPN
jgi:hypothetical protein